MHKNIIILLSFSILSLSFITISCVYKKPNGIENPVGYDLNESEKFNLPEILLEVSGIAFNKDNADFIYAQQDEDGSVFKIPMGTKEYTATKFAKKGDYEDIAICKEWVIVLKSNGELFSFPIGEINNEKANSVIENDKLLPKGEYEGMYADETSGNVYVLCKSCKSDKGNDATSGYILNLQNDGSLKLTGNFLVDVTKIDQITGKRKGKFKPSAFAINPISREWFIISSVNKVLLIADDNFKIKDAFHLSGNIFNQPEGIAFDSIGNLYISNEGSETQEGNILKFIYKKP